MINPKHPFYSANDYYREKFGSKIIKIAIDGGFTCPNRESFPQKAVYFVVPKVLEILQATEYFQLQNSLNR